jgi:hypothetical protein
MRDERREPFEELEGGLPTIQSDDVRYSNPDGQGRYAAV